MRVEKNFLHPLARVRKSVEGGLRGGVFVEIFEQEVVVRKTLYMDLGGTVVDQTAQGVGFLVAMLLFCGVRQRVENADPPESFKGLPITLVAAAITSLSFMGFGGLVENIINAIL